MNDFSNYGQSWLSRQRAAHCGFDVTYSRGTSSATVAGATKGRRPVTVQDGSGMLLSVEMTTFRLPAARLVLDGVPVKPLRGDRITTGEGWVYEVQPVSGEECWEWVAGDVDLLIRCKLVEDPDE